MPWFYDYLEDTSADLIEIDRIYCLQFDDFDFRAKHWTILSEIYASLPGNIPKADMPCWFGLPDSAVYLYASVEPPGLQIAGVLRREDWANWDASFQQQVERFDLPRYTVD